MVNLKAHLISAAIIIPISYFVLSFIGAEKQQEVEVVEQANPYFIQVYGASYGANCNGQKEYLPADENGVRKPVVVKVDRNNRLRKVSEHCNEESICKFGVNSGTMGKVDTYDCKPALEVEFRCFRVDKLQRVYVPSGDDAELDCRSITVEARMKQGNNGETN